MAVPTEARGLPEERIERRHLHCRHRDVDSENELLYRQLQREVGSVHFSPQKRIKNHPRHLHQMRLDRLLRGL
jgi:hypothetical protein